MGLAASQARFLAITARKADCEFRSMQIAQNKLSITREMELATQDYQQAINATKMVWDYDGNQSFLTDISYGFLMTPSYLNNFNPYLITDRGGRVIVDSKIAAAAEYAGIDPAEGGDRNPVNMYKFLEKLAGTGVISDKTKLDLENQIGLIKTGDHTAVFMTRFNDDGTKNWGADSGCLTNAQKDAFYRYVAANGITIDGQKYGGAGSGETAATMKAKIANLEVNGSNRYLQGKTVDYLLGLNPIADVKNSAHQVVTINGINYKFDGTTVTTGGKYNVMGKDKTCSYDMNAGYGSVPLSKNEY